MKRNWKKPVVAVMALSLVAAACGGDDDDAEPAAEPTAEETAEETADAGGDDGDDGGEAGGDSILDGAIPCEGQYEGETVEVFSPVRNSDEDPTVIAEFVAGYDPLVDCTGVEITWSGTDQFETEINVRLQGGDAPDVIDYPQPGLMASHVAQGFLQPLPDDLADSTVNDFISGWDTYATFDGTVYGIPGRSNVKSLVWYSPSRFAEAGYEIPESIDELKALSDQIVADGGVPWGVGAESGVATGWVLTDWMEDFMLRVNGEEVYDQWVNHEIPFNDPAVVEVVDAVGEFVKNPEYLGGDNLVKAIATTKFQDGGTCVATGDCWMHRQASFYSNLFPEGTDVSPEGDVWYFYLPSPADGPKYLLGAGDIYAVATDNPAAMDVLRYTGSVDYQLYMVNQRGELSPHLEIDTSAIEDELVRGLSELQLGADVFRFDASDLMPGAVGAGTFWTEITAWVIGSIDTQTFVDNVENSWPAE